MAAILLQRADLFKEYKMPDSNAAFGCSNERNAKIIKKGMTFHRYEVILQYFTWLKVLNLIYCNKQSLS